MWKPPPVELSLSNDEVHVWRADLDVSAACLSTFRHSLSADEISRAQRIHHASDKRRFIARRGVLRSLLSGYLGTRPAEIKFTYTAHGKPMLQTKGKDIALCFNLSHTSEQALYAISWGRDVGIDIERMPSSLDHDQIANSLFAAEERALLAGLPASQRAGIFLRLWACKEAYIKACGLGLSLALDQFAISIDADQPARLLYGHDRAGTLHPDLRELPSSQGHAAGLAVRGCDWHLKCWHFHAAGKEEPWSIWRDQLDS